MNRKLSELLKTIENKYSYQPIFIQAVGEVIESLGDYFDEETAEADYALLARMLEPERIITFKILWTNDKGEQEHNIGWRVQFNSALGPYKGGLRFDPSVNEDVLKFLGFEQIFKNALTGLPLGAGKGGSDFNPKGRSDNEIRAFSRAFMAELSRHIGPETDVPAGDIGVGAREIGYMYGMYKQISNKANGAVTGKDQLFGGSCGRTEATGYGVVYFADAMAKHAGLDMKGMTSVVSGSGNVAIYTAHKLIDLGSVPVTLSDRKGYLYKKDGFSHDDVIKIEKEKEAGKSLSEINVEGAEYSEGKVWEVAADSYYPCATQNEVSKEDAEKITGTAKLVVEGANMPLDDEAQAVVKKAGVLYAPGKASNAGGVAVSGMEMMQNAAHNPWSCDVVDDELQKVMNHIHSQCVNNGWEGDRVDYVKGANLAGFKRVFEAMKKLGW